MPHSSKDSEKINASTQIYFISKSLPVKNITVKKGRVQADYKTLEKKNLYQADVIYYCYKKYPIEFKLQERKKCDFIATDENGESVFIEAKQNGNVLFETLAISKGFSDYLPTIKEFSLQEGVTPLELNNIGVENFVDMYSEEYINQFLENRIRTPDYIFLASESRIISFEQFLDEYEIYAKASNHRHKEYKMAGFFFRRK